MTEPTQKPSERQGWLNFETNINLILRILVAVIVTIGIYFVLHPFFTAIIISAILAVVTWPFYTKLRVWTGNRTTLPAVIMVSAIVILIMIPISLAILALAQRIPAAIHWVRDWINSGFALPDWVVSIPYLGPWLESQHLVSLDMANLAPTVKKLIEPMSAWILNTTLNVSQGLIQIALVSFIVFFFYRDGPWFAERAREIIHRLSGNLSQEFSNILVNTTRSVIFGLIGTAIAQGIVAGIGFYITGVPRPIVLSALVTLLSIVPVGPPLVWIPASLWLYSTGEVGMAVFLALWGLLAVSSVDNFIKPILISRGTPLPISLIFLGVFGGVIAFGFLGLILGPVLLALGLAMLKAWMKSSEEELEVPSKIDPPSDKDASRRS